MMFKNNLQRKAVMARLNRKGVNVCFVHPEACRMSLTEMTEYESLNKESQECYWKQRRNGLTHSQALYEITGQEMI